MKILPPYLQEYLSDIGVSHIVELREYNPRYVEIFLREYNRIIALFDIAPLLYHVGSTSVEGLCAKPIIDMLLVYPKNLKFDDIKDILIRAGYSFREDLLPDRKYFVLENEEGVRFFALSVFREGEREANAIITFRDNLRKNKSLMREYAHIKEKLFHENVNRSEYGAQKSSFIQEHSAVLES